MKLLCASTRRNAKTFIRMWGTGSSRWLFALDSGHRGPLNKVCLTGGDIDWFIPHQANISQVTAKRLERPYGVKIYMNLQSYGNTSSAASIPRVFDEAV